MDDDGGYESDLEQPISNDYDEDSIKLYDRSDVYYIRSVIERMRHCGGTRLHYYFFLPFTPSQYLIVRITNTLHEAKKCQ